MLRVADTTHSHVQCLTAIAAGDADGLAVVLAQRFQHFAAEVAQCQYLLVAWFVDDAEPFGSNTLGELAQPEVLRQAYSWVENYWFVHNTEI